jgi:enoyl-CoA hydratase/carnithine racemase
MIKCARIQNKQALCQEALLSCASHHDRSTMSEPPTQPGDHHLLYAIEDGVAWIQFNRPQQLNSFTAELYKEIKDTIRRAEADDSVDTIVFTGTGRAFSTGGDLKSVFERITDPDPLRFAEMADSSWFDVLKNCRKMTIAAVNGVAVAAGAACAILCDASVASESATFGFPEAGAGFAESHSTHLLWGRVSLTKIKYLLYTAKQISATEAERIGMITEVVPHDRLYDRVREVVEEFRATSYDAKLLFKEYTNRMIPALDWADMYRGFETKESLEFLERFKNRKSGE